MTRTGGLGSAQPEGRGRDRSGTGTRLDAIPRRPLEARPVINIATLKNRSVKDLAEMAKKKKVLGWHAMRKEELVQSLARLARAAGGKRNGSCTASPGHNGNGHAKHLPAGSANSSKAVKLGGANGTAPAAACRSANKRHSPHFQRRLHEIKARLAEAKDLSFRTVGSGRAPAKDRLVVMVRDPFWLHAYWELSRRSIERALVRAKKNDARD